ncbi:hypothetical protein EW146_g1868 [Bondarzewia mesenterica]|uniref:Uncharacterized protein n=1 Tax=Bondarzewia mesenterica TaxID=1095465 RepID=A0A4S4M8M8_9AGAM|nr:hypothetical protein EW146_g1868 [Bondarzewia mesenterica]
MIPFIIAAIASVLPVVSGHASIWHPSMYGFNVTDKSFPYDNRPVSPLMNMPFDQWWFHGHLDFPPNPGDIFELPAGQNVTTEIGCNKGATSFFASSEGGDIRNGDDPCPGSPPSEYHTTGIGDVKGCSLAIAYKSDARDVQPDDFTVFSVNQTCVWTRFTDFSVPQRMPPCPEGGCTCAWFWIHSPDSGGEQSKNMALLHLSSLLIASKISLFWSDYMNGFRCNITNSVSNVALAKPQTPRRCGADPSFEKALPAPGNCTFGAKQPFYWFQTERNNMFEGTYAPPFYTDLYNFLDGSQDDIFEDSYAAIPTPSANQTTLPVLKITIAGQRLRLPDASLLSSISIPLPTSSIESTGSVPQTSMATSSSQASSIATASSSLSPPTVVDTSAAASATVATQTQTESRIHTVVVSVFATAPATSLLLPPVSVATTIFLNSPTASAFAPTKSIVVYNSSDAIPGSTNTTTALLAGGRGPAARHKRPYWSKRKRNERQQKLNHKHLDDAI